MSVAAIHLPRLRLPLPAVAGEARSWRDAALVFVALFAITLGAYATDERMLNDISVWVKPLKFQASLALHFATLAILARLLPAARRRARGFRVIIAASVGAGLFEIGYIMLQAARGRASHFNDATVLEEVMYALMGIGAVVLVVAPFLLGAWLWRGRGRALRTSPLDLGAALGLLISATATLVVAGYLSTQGSHWVGSVATDAGGLPLFGWSQQVGDLRVAHFFASHAMQILPLAGYVLRNRGARGSWYVGAASALYLAVIAAVFIQALLGRPFLNLAGY